MRTTYRVITGDKVETMEGGYTRLVNFTLTGKRAKDEARINQIRDIVEQLGGDFEFNYAHKSDIYRFEIGGEFETEKQGDQFIAAMQKTFGHRLVATTGN